VISAVDIAENHENDEHVMSGGEKVRAGGSLADGLFVLAAAVVALVLGYIGLSGYLSHLSAGEFGTSWPDIAYYDLQMFVLGSAPLSGPGPFPVVLQIARFLAPAVTVLAWVAALRVLLGEQARRWSAASASKHAVVTGDGPAAAVLARRLRAEYRKVVLVSSAAAGPAQPRRGVLEVHGAPADPDCLRAAGLGHAEVLYACADDSATNAATALRAREISQAHGRPLSAYAQVRDADICVALRARRIGATGDQDFRLDFFSVEELAGRVLLDRYPPVGPGGQLAPVVVIGFGQLGRAVLRQIARRRPLDGHRVEVTIVHHGPAEHIRRFRGKHPAIDRNCDVTCTSVLPDGAEGGVPALVFVCLPDNDDALRAGLAAAHAPARRSDRVVICMSEPSPFGAALSGGSSLLDDAHGRMTVFEVIEEACVPDGIREDLADQLARAIHRAYVEACAARGDSPRVNLSMCPWEELPETLRRSNIAQAMDIGVKLDAINCTIIPESDAAPDFAFTSDEIEMLAKMEHERWVRDRTAAGLKYGSARDDEHHPDLVEWSYLSETAQNKDRDAIRQLPAILGEAGFQILRLPPAAGSAGS